MVGSFCCLSTLLPLPVLSALPAVAPLQPLAPLSFKFLLNPNFPTYLHPLAPLSASLSSLSSSLLFLLLLIHYISLAQLTAQLLSDMPPVSFHLSASLPRQSSTSSSPRRPASLFKYRWYLSGHVNDSKPKNLQNIQ